MSAPSSDTVMQFTYLGCIPMTDFTTDAQVNQRFNKAFASFAQVRKRVITNHNLRITTKVTIFRAICLSVLFYASETITLYRRHINQLDSFHMPCLKKILKLTWQYRVSYRAGLLITNANKSYLTYRQKKL